MSVSSNTRPRVCIVTNEILGPFRNGGIGTAMTGMALTLASARFPVTILYTGSAVASLAGLARWQRHYAKLGIELVALPIEQMKTLGGPVAECGFGMPWLVYSFLETRDFDVVHFNDSAADGCVAIAAKRLGIAWSRTLFALGMHSPAQWQMELNRTLPSTPLVAAHNYAERSSIRNADVLWTPSHYMLEWARAHGFEFPEQTFVQQNALPELPRKERAGETIRPSEIVFFGRLEERKGLRLFCDVIDSMHTDLAAAGITVTFLGKPAQLGRERGDDYVALRARDWQARVLLILDLGQSEALARLARGESLAVMASPADNSPCTVYEALECGVPFLASRAGGIPELIAEEDRDRVLFEPTFEGLRSALQFALVHGARVARPAVPQQETKRRWIAIHEQWEELLPRTKKPTLNSLPAVAIVQHDPGSDLAQTIESLEACDAVRSIVVLHQTTTRSIQSRIPIRTFSLTAAPRVADVLEGVGDETVLFVHSGVRLRSGLLPRVIASLQGQEVEAVVPAALAEVRRARRLVVPLGGSPAFSLHHGITFTGGLLIRSAPLRRALNGRSLIRDAAFGGMPDVAVAHGVEILPWPEPLFEFVQPFHPNKPGRSPERVAIYNECSAIERFYMLAIGYSALNGGPAAGRLRALAAYLTALGFGSFVRRAVRVMKMMRRLRTLLRSRRR
jgi:glycosyltransferase involved in cell wall biosynthesis